MEFILKNKTILLLVLGVVIAIGVWWGISGDAPQESLITTENVAGESASERGLVDTLLQLRSVSLTGTIFSDPAFMGLQDFGTQIIPEAVGRPNPFAPPSFRATTTRSSASTQLFAPGR